MAMLRILSGDMSGQTVDLQGATIVVGRHPTCDIRVPDDTVSRRHAQIVADADGYVVEDLGSRNGTFLNGRKVTGPERLSHLDKISIFNTAVEFREDQINGASENAALQTIAFEGSVPPTVRGIGLFETIAEIDLTAPGVPPSIRESDVRLQAVLQITRYLRSTLEPDEVLSRIVECVTHIFPQYARSYLLRHDTASDQLTPVVIRYPEDEAGGPPTLRPVIRALARHVLAEGKALLSVGAADGDSAAETESVLSDDARSFMCAPLVGPSLKAAGILYIETSDTRRSFTLDDLEVFACVSILAGQAIEQAIWFGARYREVVETLEQQVRDRTESVRLLQDVAVIANESESVEQAFQIALGRVLRFRSWDIAHVVVRARGEQAAFIDAGIWSVEMGGRYRKLISAAARAVFRPGQGLIGRAVTTGKPEWAADLGADSTSLIGEPAAAYGMQAAAACPVLIGAEVVAVIIFLSAEPSERDEAFLEIMQHVGTQLGRVIERDRLQRQLVDAVWDQHRRLGQELHDTLGQALTGIGMFADSLAKRVARHDEPEAAQLAELVGMIQQAKSEVRQLSKGLYPVDVDARGLLTALDELALTTRERAQIRCTFRGDREIQIRDNEVATHLFRIAQEAVHNAVKHGRPSRISIALTRPRGRVTLAIRDDGSGVSVEPAPRSNGLGMRIMQYRANAIGASLSVEATKTAGTMVRCTLKREEEDAPTEHG